jgi:hypothetical protein
MPKRQNHQYKRTARMDRTMEPGDLHLLNYAILLKTACHKWSWDFLDTLSPAAAKILRAHLSAALVRNRGYAGFHVPDDLLCSKIREITGQKCQLSTLRNGRRELEAKGLITRSQAPSARSKGIHLGGDSYTQPRWCVSMLTPKCVAMFDNRNRLVSEETALLYSVETKSNACSKTEDLPPLQEQGGEDLKATTTDEVGQKHQCELVLDSEPSTRQNSPPSASPGEQGNPTCPSSSSCSSRSTGEQRPSTSDATTQGGQTEPPPLSWEALNKASRFGRGASWSGSRGCSVERPKIPRGARKRKDRTFAKAKIFNALHRELWNYPGPQADDIFARAKVEFELVGFSSFNSVCNLPYWLSRAPKLTVNELRGHMRGTIIPALKFSGPTVTTGRFSVVKPTRPACKAVKMAGPAGKMPSFLKKFAKSRGLEKD